MPDSVDNPAFTITLTLSPEINFIVIDLVRDYPELNEQSERIFTLVGNLLKEVLP